MEVQSVYQQRAQREGWEVVTPTEWFVLFGWWLGETKTEWQGTAFHKKETRKAFATNHVGEAAWKDLCNIASIE